MGVSRSTAFSASFCASNDSPSSVHQSGSVAGGRRRAELLEHDERIRSEARAPQHECEPHRPAPALRLERRGGLQLLARLGEVAARGLRLADERMPGRPVPFGASLEILGAKCERAADVAERERALTVDEPHLGILDGDGLEVTQQRRAPCLQSIAAVAHAMPIRARRSPALPLGASQPALNMRERLLRLAQSQVRVGELVAVTRVLSRQLLGPIREVRLERADRIGPLPRIVEVVPQEQLRVVPCRLLRDDLLEQRHAAADVAREHELRAERGQHLGVGRRQRLRATHERDPILVLLARGEDRGAQHVGLDAARVERDRLIERLRGVVEVAASQRARPSSTNAALSSSA